MAGVGFRFLERSAVLVAIEDGLDSSRRDGQALIAAFVRGTRWERSMAGARIRVGRARARSGREAFGYPELPYAGRIADRPDVLEYIHALRDEGLTLIEIAKRLDDEGIPTARGGRLWWGSTVRSALRYPRPS